MEAAEIILFPFYILIFYVLVLRYARKNADVLLQRYLKQLFWIKTLACLAFTAYILFFSSGDSHDLYYFSGSNIFKMILANPSQVDIFFKSAKDLDPGTYSQIGSGGYIDNASNYSVVKIAGLLSFFSFGKYLLLNFLFAMLSLTGIWKLFLFFYKKFPQYHLLVAFAFIYLPNFQFWSAGTGKEAISIACLGWITYCSYNVLVEKKHLLKNVVFIFIASYLLFTVKAYILLSYAPIFFLFGIAGDILQSKNQLLNLVLKMGIFAVGAAGIYFILSSNKDGLGEFAIQEIAESAMAKNELYQKIAENTESSFDLGVTLDGSVSGLVKATPFAITATLFRPFIWEAKKISSLLSALESLLLIFITLRPIIKYGPFHFLKTLFSNKTVLYAFTYSIIFAIFVGMTTLNFGSLIRYKIPCLPFYTISMLLINQILAYNKAKAPLK